MKKAIAITLICLAVITSVCIPAFANVVTASEDVVYPVINPNRVTMSFDWDGDQETDNEVTFYFTNEIIDQKIGQRESYEYKADNDIGYYYYIPDVSSASTARRDQYISGNPFRVYYPDLRESDFDVVSITFGRGDFILENSDGTTETAKSNSLYVIPSDFEELSLYNDLGYIEENAELLHYVTIERAVHVWDGKAEFDFNFGGLGLNCIMGGAEIVADNVVIGLDDNYDFYTSDYYARAYAYVYGNNEQDYLKYDLVYSNPDFRNGASFKYEFDSQYDSYYQTFGKNNVVVWWSDNKRELGIVPDLSDTQTIVYVDDTGYERDYTQQYLFRITGFANPNTLAYVVPDMLENTFVYDFIPVEYVERSPTLAITSGLPWGWITNELESFSLTGFLDGVTSFFFTDLFGYFSIADIIGIVVGIALLFAFLKLFVGG